MPPPELDLFAAECGSVTAPAGCGKTQLIADTLGAHQGAKPILILTHTNAGVSALRYRMHNARVPTGAYRIMTIDGFSIRLIRKFPMRSGHDPGILNLHDRDNDYVAIRAAASQLVESGHLKAVLRASYARLLVDEYQDCNQPQHALICAISQIIPTSILGDPMQAIFGWPGNELVNWNNDVLPHFPAIGRLRNPWRWRLAGTERLGAWLLEARGLLEAGHGVDLGTAPDEVRWVRIAPQTARQQRISAAGTRANGDRKVIIIGDSAHVASRHLLSRDTFGATTLEPVDLPDLIEFSRTFDLAADSVVPLVRFIGGLMTQVGATQFLARVRSIRNNRHENPPTEAEAVAVAYANEPTWRNAAALLKALAAQRNARIYRPEMYRCLSRAIQVAAGGAHTLHQAVTSEREKYRHLGRPLARRSVGSTLLVKGLEADIAVLLNPEAMSAQNLYVAMTRGSRQLVICSANQILRPAVPR